MFNSLPEAMSVAVEPVDTGPAPAKMRPTRGAALHARAASAVHAHSRATSALHARATSAVTGRSAQRGGACDKRRGGQADYYLAHHVLTPLIY